LGINIAGCEFLSWQAVSLIDLPIGDILIEGWLRSIDGASLELEAIHLRLVLNLRLSYSVSVVLEGLVELHRG
jgi:hypothetical protein